MRLRLVKRAIISITIIIIFLLLPCIGSIAAEPELKIDSEFNYMFGAGGVKITITVKGDLAKELRQDIFDDFLINPDATVSVEKQVEFSEAIEDLLERNINPLEGGKDDKDPEDAGVDFKGVFKITKIDPEENRAEVNSVDGLVGTKKDDSTEIVIKMDLEGEVVENSEIVLSDGYIILYALFGEKRPLNTTEVQETTTILLVGMSSYSNLNLAAGGEVTHYRLVLGEYFEYKNTYKLNGYEMDKNKKDTVQLDSFNVIQSPLVLAIIILAFTIVAGMIVKLFLKENLVKKVKHLRIIAIIFFIVLAILYFISFDGLFIWILTIMFFVVNVVLGYGIYQKGWGKLALVEVRHEDYVRAPPTIEEGPWHERGIANAKIGNFLEAVNCFENALEAEPENATIWNDLGFVLRKLGKYRPAIDCFNKALSLRPNYPTAKENLEKTQREIEARAQKD